MCEPTTILYSVAALAGGYVAAKAMTPDIPSAPPPQAAIPDTGTPGGAPAPTPPAPPPTPPKSYFDQWTPVDGGGSHTVTPGYGAAPGQVAVNAPKAPSIPNIKANNAGAKVGANASSASTLLTGPQGADMTGVKLGKNTLLGM